MHQLLQQTRESLRTRDGLLRRLLLLAVVMGLPHTVRLACDTSLRAVQAAAGMRNFSLVKCELSHAGFQLWHREERL